jgi:hypothetical protein
MLDLKMKIFIIFHQKKIGNRKKGGANMTKHIFNPDLFLTRIIMIVTNTTETRRSSLPADRAKLPYGGIGSTSIRFRKLPTISMSTAVNMNKQVSGFGCQEDTGNR